MRRSVSGLTYLASQKGIRIEADDQSLEILGDGPKLVQVMVNLLSNAIKFSPPKSQITVAYSEIDGAVEVSVADQGRGIPQQHREKIFQRFEQVEQADVAGGKGLGLSICKAIIEAHGGTIQVESEGEGAGSRFRFKLPQPD